LYLLEPQLQPKVLAAAVAALHRAHEQERIVRPCRAAQQQRHLPQHPRDVANAAADPVWPPALYEIVPQREARAAANIQMVGELLCAVKVRKDVKQQLQLCERRTPFGVQRVVRHTAVVGG